MPEKTYAPVDHAALTTPRWLRYQHQTALWDMLMMYELQN